MVGDYNDGKVINFINNILNEDKIEIDLEKNQDKIDWNNLSRNPLIFELDYNALKKRCNIYKEELIQKAIHPNRILKYLEQGVDIENLENFI